MLVNGVWQLLRAMKRQNQIALQLIAHWAGRRGVHGSSTRAAGCTGQEEGKGGGMGARGQSAACQARRQLSLGQLNEERCEKKAQNKRVK